MDKKSQPKHEVSPTIMFKNNIPQNRMKANKGRSEYTLFDQDSYSCLDRQSSTRMGTFEIMSYFKWY